MFKGLKSLLDLKEGMVIDGPHKGDIYYARNLDILELPEHHDLPAITCDPDPTVKPLTFRKIVYYKCFFVIYGERYYLWSVHSTEYWRGQS